MRLLDFLLDRLYAELAWAYDLISWVVSLGRWAAWQRVALRYVQEGRVLEVGCGTGRLLHPLAGRGAHPVGCDLSPAMLRQARRHVEAAIPLCRARAQALPFAPACFDTVVSTFPAPYINDPRTWTEFARVLGPAGRVVVVYGVGVGNKTPGQRLVRWLLALGRTNGVQVRPAWEGSGLRVERQVVPEGTDRVGLLVGEKD